MVYTLIAISLLLLIVLGLAALLRAGKDSESSNDDDLY